jgi:hypothetical protein
MWKVDVLELKAGLLVKCGDGVGELGGSGRECGGEMKERPSWSRKTANLYGARCCDPGRAFPPARARCARSNGGQASQAVNEQRRQAR